MDPQVKVIAWLVFMLLVSGFLGSLAFIVWRNDQKPLYPARRLGAVYPPDESDPPKEEKDG